MAKRRLTAKQRKAGFGGKRAMSGGQTKAPRRSKPKTRTRTRTKTVVKYRTRSAPKKKARRRRGGGGGGKGFLGLPMPGINIEAAALVAGGMLGYKIVPGLILKVWPGMPQIGYMGYAIKAVGVIGLGLGAAMLVSRPRAAQLVAGGLAMLMYELFNDQVAPRIGLSALTGDLATIGDLSGIVGPGITEVSRVPTQSRAVQEAAYAA